MANTILTPTAVTRAALAILHQKLNFIGNIYRGYDSRFAQSGAKIGDTLTIRLPNEYTVRTGPNLSAQDTTESSTTLTVSTQKGVDVSFSSSELTLSLQDFSERILDPAMAVLASNIEADALSMAKDVYNLVDGDAAAFAFGAVVDAKTLLSNTLTPMADRSMVMNMTHASKLIKDRKDAFNPSSDVSKMFREGLVDRVAGFDLYENTLLLPHLTGSALKATSYTVSGAVTTNGAAAVTLTGAATTWKKGDVFTVVGCNRVHPETKADTGVLQQFVCLADCTTAMTFAPAIYTSGARQNVVAAGMANGVALVKVGAGANETLVQSLAFHKNAFTFATADLVMPTGVDFAAREVMDGISMRIVRDYAISTDTFPCRIDVLYGYKTLRPQLATRVHNDA